MKLILLFMIGIIDLLKIFEIKTDTKINKPKYTTISIELFLFIELFIKEVDIAMEDNTITII